MSSMTTNICMGAKICRDNKDDLYISGDYTGTVDFDPGPGSFSMTCASIQSEIFLWKLDKSGNFIWAKTFANSGISGHKSSYCGIASDVGNNVILAGAFSGQIDLDPGLGTDLKKATGTAHDMFAVKLDPNGNLLWNMQLGGNQNDYITSVAISPDEKVFFTGFFADTVDFDPGAGVVKFATKTREGFHLKMADCKVNDTISLSGNILSAKGTGTAYQWVKCPSYTVIPGATAKSYTVTSSGNYALIIDDGSCRDTSDCISVKPSSLDHFDQANLIKIYPNPSADGNVTIQLPDNMLGAIIQICNVLGQKISATTAQSEHTSLKLNSGFYFVEISAGEEKVLRKIVVE